MKIAVCIKQVRHCYARSGHDPARHYLAAEDEVRLINPCDEAAMNLAVRLKEQTPGGEILALTLGPLIAPDALMGVLALGADHWYRIPAGAGADTWGRATLLAAALRELAPDLILCGQESLDGRTGAMGAFVAGMLGLPLVSPVEDLEVEGGRAKVRRYAGRGRREIVACALPAVLGVEMGAVELRLPTLPAKRWARALIPRELTPAAEAAGPRLRSLGVYAPHPRAKAKQPPRPDLGWYTRVDELLKGGGAEKSARMVKGDPAELAGEIFDFLVERGFVETTEDAKDSGSDD